MNRSQAFSGSEVVRLEPGSILHGASFGKRYAIVATACTAEDGATTPVVRQYGLVTSEVNLQFACLLVILLNQHAITVPFPISLELASMSIVEE